jgi:hypothetical protein
MDAGKEAVERELSSADHRVMWWIGAVGLAAMGLTELVSDGSQLFHSHQLSFDILLPLVVCSMALAWSIKFRCYIRDALREGLVGERVANNCQYLIAMQQIITGLAMLFFHRSR